MDAAAVHRFLRSLPEVTEYEHGGLPAFRVKGKRFASMLDDTGINLMLGEEGIHAAAAEWPDHCTILLHGQRVSAIRVDHTGLEPDLIQELIMDSWRRHAPARLVTEWDRRMPLTRESSTPDR